MRTKTRTLVLTLALGLAGSFAAMAQSVYSLNAVGYVNTPVPTGYSIFSNPLNASTNKLSSLLGSATQYVTVYKYVGDNFQIAVLDDNGSGTLTWDNDLTLAPGEAAWIYNPNTPFTNTFVGEVPTGTALTNPIPVGFSLKSSIVPQSGVLDTDLGFPAAQYDTVYIWKNSINNFVISVFDDNGTGTLAWDNIPTPAVGEGFWIYTTAPKSWIRSFTLN